MKVLLVSSNSGSVGGGERYLSYLARGLCLLGHEVHALVGNQEDMNPVAERLVVAGAILHRAPITALRERRLRFVSACLDQNQQRKLSAIYRAIAPDVIHVNQQYDEDGLDMLMAADRASLPVVGVIHLPMCRTKLQRPLGQLRSACMRLWYRRLKYPKIFCSRETETEFREFYHCDDTVIQIDNATFDCGDSTIQSARRPSGWSRDEKVIGFVGRLDEQKDPLLLIQAWTLLSHQSPRTRLLVVGDGVMRSETERIVAENGLGNDMYITGWVPDVRPWFQLMDVYALTSRFEGMPQSLIEAVCEGLRVVAVVGPGIPGVLKHAEWAVGVFNRTPACLANAISLALASDRPAPGQVAAARNHFSVQRMAREVLQVYQLAISG